LSFEDPIEFCLLSTTLRLRWLYCTGWVVVRENSKKKKRKKKLQVENLDFARELRVVLVFEKDVALILEALPF
jgi:hypothetical protein